MRKDMAKIWGYFEDPMVHPYTQEPKLKHEIEVWRKAFNSLSGYSRDEDTVRAILHRKITVLETLLRKKLYDAKISEDDYRASLKELTNAFKLKNTSLLLKSGIVISIVIIFFFLESIPALNLSIAILVCNKFVAVLLCILAASLTRHTTRLQQVNANDEVTTRRTCSKLVTLNLQQTCRVKLIENYSKNRVLRRALG
ncbi:hypothetical protein AVEN_41588-1 [Araneus ventricosus]|uniref:Uncharacterized protein n=1 Tax=Araneus ventricosus TaxID=182803 RepID=A0A4Y2TD82_ARAVE|nr:hypothetical protein AVEN_41588-1 [Araneus ventricosus]